ncbi:speckle-type POZ [Fusarium beomiforme]|uniref:Speckle-type POZ n=1 Tax=Fusarium beomiforme TaxID=44412 RepID=A0A9P5A7I1_9HYPO|nr:speckle-type POZ [Fusarium beomiforme]
MKLMWFLFFFSHRGEPPRLSSLLVIQAGNGIFPSSLHTTPPALVDEQESSKMAPQANSGFLSLLETGQFSDFTLVCEGREFKLHQAIVCPQSPVIMAALGGGFQESTSKIITVNEFDVSIVEYMIGFLYTGDYKLEAQAKEEPIHASDQDRHEQEHVEGVEAEEETISEPGDFEEQGKRMTTSIVSHLRIHAIADYYNIKSLAKLATSKVKAKIKNNFCCKIFPDIIQEMSAFNRDSDLRSVIISAMVDTLPQLIYCQEFQRLDLDQSLCSGNN